MFNIVFLDQASFPEGYNQLPNLDFPHKLKVYKNTKADEVISRCIDADIVITNKVIFNSDNISKLPKLKLIAISATGTNNVDIEFANKQNIKVLNVTGYSNLSVAEHVIGFIFALRRGLPAYYRDQLNEKWPKSELFCYYNQPILDVAGTTLAILGKGDVGKKVAEKAKLLGMNVIFLERPKADKVRDGYVSFNEGLSMADIITLHCPLNEDTKYIINPKTLNLLKPSAYLINTGRGPLVDEQALADAIINKKIAGAAVDVLGVEPPHEDNPLIKLAAQTNNLIITPHVAWASVSAIGRLLNGVCQNLNNFAKEI